MKKLMSSVLTRLALTEPEIARRLPTFWSSNLGHRIPGVSHNDRWGPIGIHCWRLVTAGRFSTLAAFFLASLLI